MAGKTPDLNKIPQDFLQSLINKSPQLFANIVSQELLKKIGNDTRDNSPNDGSISFSSDSKSISRDLAGKSITYDVNSLDKKADISMYGQHDNNQTATLWTAIVLGIVGFFTLVLIIVLCWRRQRNRRLKAEAQGDNRRLNLESASPNSIIIDPKSIVRSTTVNETEEGREIRENRLNADISRNLRVAPSVPQEETRNQREVYTQQWVFTGNGTQM